MLSEEIEFSFIDMKKITVPNKPGIYVLSFDMEIPMVYFERSPWSKSYVSNQMIKVGKEKNNLRKRMDDYKKTYGYREFEPQEKKVQDHWKDKGYKNTNFKKCLGCDQKHEHHHVTKEYIKATDFISNDNNYLDKEIHSIIEATVKEEFSDFLLKGHNNIGNLREYYDKSAKKPIIFFIEELLSKYE